MTATDTTHEKTPPPRRTRTPVLYFTRGLPASGKSTWAKEQLTRRPAGALVRVNKDLLRAMLHDDRHQGRTEKQVLAARDRLVVAFLADGVDVIVDDTNLNPVHEIRLRAVAADGGARFEVVDFTHVPLDECIRRDAGRPHPVGEQVIRGMHRQYLRVEPAPPEVAPGAPRTVICDIDGTLARMNGRSPYAWHRVGEDEPVTAVVELVQLLHAAGVTVVYLSGRDGSCREQTQAWLEEHVRVPGALHMRAAGDKRPDDVVKRELFDTHVRASHDVRWVLDDRDRVVRLWRDTVGLTCLQVAPGDF